MFSSDDPLPIVFDSLGAALGYMEAIDVEDGIYPALYAVDGRVVQASTAGNSVILTLTDRRDEAALRDRLKEWASRSELASDPNDPVAVANELMQNQWNSRSPKRPRWLARRLHGERPSPI